MSTPSANAVCGRCWKNPMTYLSILTMITGLLGTFTTVSIGYYMVYREGKSLGLCYVVEYPGIRRACVLDLTGGVMSILISVMILMVEFFSAYLNKNDWKVIFSVINFLLAFVTVIVLLAGTVQGALAYSDYCHSDDDIFNPFDLVYKFYKYKRCDFDHGRSKYEPDVDFVAVVALSGVGALFWMLVLGTACIQGCWFGYLNVHNSVGLSVQADGYQPLPTEMNEMRPAPPNYSEM